MGSCRKDLELTWINAVITLPARSLTGETGGRLAWTIVTTDTILVRAGGAIYALHLDVLIHGRDGPEGRTFSLVSVVRTDRSLTVGQTRVHGHPPREDLLVTLVAIGGVELRAPSSRAVQFTMMHRHMCTVLRLGDGCW